MKRQQTTSFYLETLLLVLIFVGVLLVLTQVFALGKRESRSARDLTDAVILASNAAEAMAASMNEGELLALLNENGNAELAGEGLIRARYDGRMAPDPAGATVLELRYAPEGDRGFVRGTVTVCCEGEPAALYELDAAAIWKEAAA